jgi:hypothetical protein
MLRVIRPDPVNNEVLSSNIGFGDEVDLTLGGDLRGAEFLDQQVPRLARNVSGKVEHRIYKIFRIYKIQIKKILKIL